MNKNEINPINQNKIAEEALIDFERTLIKGVEIKRCRYSNQSYKKHLHHELSLGIIEEGSTNLEIGDKIYTLRKGDAILIPPHISHLCSPQDICHWQFTMIYIEARYFEDEAKHWQVMKLSRPVIDKVNLFLKKLLEEQSREVLEEILVELCVFLEDTQLNKKSITGLKNEIDAQIIGQVKTFLESHYMDSVNLELLEERFQMNRFSIIRKFKVNYNTTPMAYLLQLKVAKAKECIGKGMEILDICHTLGFYDQAHFIREFKRMNGITPMHYQKQVRMNP